MQRLKPILTVLLIFFFTSCKTTQVSAQNYGDQTPITINGIVCLLHYNGDNSVKHPLLMMFQGADEYGSNPAKAAVHGTGWAIKNGMWNPDSVYNFKTGQYESFIVLSVNGVGQNQPPSFAQQDALFTYMRNNYPVDSTCMGTTGLSAGGGAALSLPSHTSGSNCCPPVYTFATPKNIMCAVVSMSPEILDSSQGVTQPVQFEVADSIPVWGWSDLADCQGHGIPIQHWVQHVQRLAPTLGAIYTSYHCNVGCGHGCWDSIYTATTRQIVDGHSMNIYEWQLYHRRGSTPPPPPTNTIATGTISLSSFCVTPSSGQNFTTQYSSTGTWNAGNTFNVQMSAIGGSFGTFTVVGSSTTTNGSGTINCSIPQNTPTGNRKFRVVSTQPAANGSQSALFPINLAANQILPNNSQTIIIGQSTNTLTVRDSSTATHIWYVDNVATSSTGATFASSTLTVGSHTIYCQSTFPCAIVNSNVVNITVSPNASSKVYVTPNVGCGVYNWSSANPGDTLVLSPAILGDTVCQLTFIHLHGTAAKHITIIAEGGVIKSTAPLTLADDCYYVDINFGTQVGLPHATGLIPLGQYGSQSYDVPYGLEVFGAVTGGGGLEIHGKDSNITASNIYVHDRGAVGGFAGYGIIIKNDPNAFGCDSSYAYPNMFKNIILHDFVFKNINKDVLYLGYSGGYNTGGQSVTCNGVQRFFRPAGIGNLLCYNMYCENALRSFIQAGQLWGGKCVFHDMYAYNLGNDSLNGVIDGSQGAFAAMGIPDSSWTIYNCGAACTWLHNVYTYGYGIDSVYNNKFDSAGYVHLPQGGVAKNNGQSNIALFPRQNVSNTTLGYIFRNNLLGINTQGSGGASNANIRFDFGTSPAGYAQSGNEICGNVGQIIYTSGIPLVYSTCATNTLITNNISPSTFCVTASIGANVTVGYTSTGTYNSANIFTAQLSDQFGNFAGATNIGSVNATTSGNISCIIPANTITSAAYKIRVISSNPIINGTQSNTTISINLAGNSIAPSATQNILTNANGNTLTVSEQSNVISRQWFSNGVAIAGQTGATYTPNFTTAGTYSVICRSTFACATITSNAVTINVTDPIQPAINTNPISGSPFCVTTSVGATLNVGFTSVGTYNSGNQYIAQLSNATGGFASPINIGTLNSTASAGTIVCTIPSNTPTGSAYKIRVISTNPSVVGSSRTGIIINLAANVINPIDTQNIFTNTAGNILTVTDSSIATSNQWYSNNVAISGQTALTYTPLFATAGTYSITEKSTFACGVITSNPVIIIATDPPPPPPDSVFTGTISGSPFCVTLSAGASVSVPFTSNRGSFNSGNIFTAQLSNATGSFASPITIGSLTSTAASGTVSATIPTGTTTGAGYRIRVRSSNPTATLIRNGSALTINLASNFIAPSATQNIYTDANGNTLTVNETSTAISRLWFVNGVSTGISTTTYTPNFSSAGTYNIDCRSVFACGTIISNAVSVIVTTPPAPTINTGTISGSPFCVTASATASVSVPYTITGTFNAGNVFTVQLSDPTGNFNSFTVIGSTTSTGAGTISATIPANTLTGAGYNIRVVSSDPVITGNDNGDNLAINLAVNSIAPTNTQNIYTDSTGAALTVTEASTALSRQWYANNVSIAGQTGAIYTPVFNAAGTYLVTCKSVFACGTITSNSVTVNVTDIPPPPPDTICSVIQIQHDTTYRDTQVIVTSQTDTTIIPMYDTVKRRHYARLNRYKVDSIFVVKVKITTVYDTTYRYFDTTTITPLHDTVICVITTSFNDKQELPEFIRKRANDYYPLIYYDLVFDNRKNIIKKYF